MYSICIIYIVYIDNEDSIYIYIYIHIYSEDSITVILIY